MDLEQLIKLLISEKGGTSKQYHLLMNKIANHESGMDSSIHQLGGGPGRGLYQFEIGDNKGAKTASNRLINYLNGKGKQIPQWLKNTTKNKSIDVSTLTPGQQSMLFLGNMREHPTADLGKVMDGSQSTVDFWLDNHWAGKKADRFQRKQSFIHSIKSFNDKNTKVNYTLDKDIKSSYRVKDNIPTISTPRLNKSYNLDLSRFNLNEPVKKETVQPIVQQGKNKLDQYLNQNIAALGGNLGQTQIQGEFNPINSGGTHESNKYNGVPQGMGQNGKLNTVEEKETTYNFKEGKYVFSERLKL